MKLMFADSSDIDIVTKGNAFLQGWIICCTIFPMNEAHTAFPSILCSTSVKEHHTDGDHCKKYPCTHLSSRPHVYLIQNISTPWDSFSIARVIPGQVPTPPMATEWFSGIYYLSGSERIQVKLFFFIEIFQFAET